MRNRYSFIAGSEVPLYVHPDEAQEMVADLDLLSAEIARLQSWWNDAKVQVNAERLAHEQTKRERDRWQWIVGHWGECPYQKWHDCTSDMHCRECTAAWARGEE